MLQKRIQHHQQAAGLAQLIAAMPEYPIYREVDGRYSIYIDRQQHLFASETAARLAQLTARARWLCTHRDG